MGLFGNKKHDDHSNGTSKTVPPDGSTEPSMADNVSEAAQGNDARSVSPTTTSADYGIADAIKLMRTLPQDNSELVVRVMVATLESVNVSITRLIEDANQAERDLQSTVATLNKEIKSFEGEITTRKDRIRTLEEDLKQTSAVRERLAQAERARAARVGPAPKPPEGKRSSSSTSGSSFRVAPLRPNGG